MITKVLLVSRNKIIRDRLRILFNKQTDMHLVCEIIDGEAATLAPVTID